MAFTFGVGSLAVAALFCGVYLATYLVRCLLAWHRYQKAPRQRMVAALFTLTSLGVTIGGFAQPAIEGLWNSDLVRLVRTRVASEQSPSPTNTSATKRAAAMRKR